MSEMTPWWHKHADGDFVSVVLIQFDLVGHSAWSADQEQRGSRKEAYDARKRLSKDLRKAVAGYGFDLHHWAGDGGLFVAACQNPEDADEAYKAMVQMHNTFVRWREERESTKSFSCRITGTYIPDVCVDHDPGNWYSAELNRFLKYERDIGGENAICITNDLRRVLDAYRSSFDVPKRQVNLPDGSSIAVFADRGHPLEIRESRRSFRGWLARNYTEMKSADPLVRLHGLLESMYQIGDAVILNAGLSPSGYRFVELDQKESTRFDGSILIPQDRDRWCEAVSELAKSNVRGTKLRVHALAPEFLDDPTVRLSWSLGDYRDANAFHTMVASDAQVAQRYLGHALKVLQDGTTIPNTLSNHAVVILGSDPERYLLLCHRRKGHRPGTYSRNRWSASFEEQYNPIEETIDGDVLKRDLSIVGSIERGLREEIVGEDYGGNIKITTHAFQLESMILNFGFLAIVELPDLDFYGVLALWPKAKDSDEHDVLAALPLREELLRTCLAISRLPEQVFPSLLISRGFPGLGPNDHAWHQTSPARIALALWLAQLGRV